MKKEKNKDASLTTTNKIKNKFSLFFNIRSTQIPLLFMLSILGLIIGFFASPQKYCYMAKCEIDKSKGATLNNTSLCNAIISEDHLSKLASFSGDNTITYLELREGISIDLTMSENYFVLRFSLSNLDHLSSVANSFEPFSIDYLNDNVKELRHTLLISDSSVYKTRQTQYALISSLSCFAVTFVLYYFLCIVFNYRKAKGDSINE